MNDTKRKMLAVDFDGTVFFHEENGYRPEDVEAIKAFQKEGNLVGLNTGRAVGFCDHFEPLAKNQIDFDFYICNSGGQLADEKEQIWKQFTMDLEFIKTISAVFPDVVQAVPAGNTYYSLAGLKNPFFDNAVESFDELEGMDIYGMCFEPADNAVANHIKSVLDPMNLPVTIQVNQGSVDISPLGVNKGEGLKLMAEHLGIDMDHVYALGDGDNDIPAMKEAAIGFAMANGSDGVKEAADYTVSGVKEAIERIKAA